MKSKYNIFDTAMKGDLVKERRYPFWTVALPRRDSSLAAQHKDFNQAFKTTGKLIRDSYNKQAAAAKEKNG